jgi:hypothetical protein
MVVPPKRNHRGGLVTSRAGRGRGISGGRIRWYRGVERAWPGRLNPRSRPVLRCVRRLRARVATPISTATLERARTSDRARWRGGALSVLTRPVRCCFDPTKRPTKDPSVQVTASRSSEVSMCAGLPGGGLRCTKTSMSVNSWFSLPGSGLLTSLRLGVRTAGGSSTPLAERAVLTAPSGRHGVRWAGRVKGSDAELAGTQPSGSASVGHGQRASALHRRSSCIADRRTCPEDGADPRSRRPRSDRAQNSVRLKPRSN